MVSPKSLGRKSFRLPTTSITELVRALTEILSQLVQDNRNKVLFTETVDLPSIASGASYTLNFPALGVNVGDVVLGVSLSTPLLGLTIVTSEVTTPNVVDVVFVNSTGGAVDLQPCTVRVIMERIT